MFSWLGSPNMELAIGTPFSKSKGKLFSWRKNKKKIFFLDAPINRPTCISLHKPGRIQLQPDSDQPLHQNTVWLMSLPAVFGPGRVKIQTGVFMLLACIRYFFL